MKRNDLQGLRGLAISAVILFHFFPGKFPNGYLGVDQFFVLSGFLITMILHKSPSIDISTLQQFYYRRVKRIVPMYLLVVCLILISLLFVFPFSFIFVNMESAKRSLMFISNVAQSNEVNYYAELDKAENVFTHTWSLSVEMQYYLIVPILYKTIRLAPSNYQSFGFLIVFIASLIIHCIVEPSRAFNNVFARIWQFSVGSIAYHESQPAEKTNSLDEEPLLSSKITDFNTDYRNQYIKMMVLEALLLVSYLDWNSLDQIYTRIITTLLTGLILLTGGSVQSPLLTNRVLVYLGDISYSVYLVHWPIYVGIKTYFSDYLIAYFIGIILSFVLAAILTETYEKWYLQASCGIVWLIITILFVINIGILVYSGVILSKDAEKSNDLSQAFGNNTDLSGEISNSTELENAVKINEYYIGHDLQLLNNEKCIGSSSFGWCDMSSSCNTSSNSTALIIGNSYATNLGDLVLSNCGQKFKVLKQVSVVACEPLVTTIYASFGPFGCQGNVKHMIESVQKEQPDYLFVLARWITMANSSIDLSIDADKHFIEANRTLTEYIKYVKKKIFVLNVLPNPRNDFLKDFNKLLSAKGISARLDSPFDPRFDTKSAYIRLNELVKRCSKCEFIEIEPSLTWNGTYHLFDDQTGISYFTNGMHISPHGKPLVSSVFKKVCDRI